MNKWAGLSAHTLLSVFLLMITVSAICEASYTLQLDYSVGVWNDFDFSRPAEDWSKAAHKYGGKNAVMDLIVAQADINGFAMLPFPLEDSPYLRSSSQTDKAEPYLKEFDSEGLKVILSIQPSRADVTQIMRILLSRYGHHSSIIGVNIDLEWKETGRPTYASNEERDSWLKEMKGHNSDFKLFLTYFGDYTHFPQDTADLVILFDGEGDTQANILSRYKELADHYSSIGIYTGYSSSIPEAASHERILATVPNTRYIIHTYDVFSNKPILIFYVDDVQVDWLESITIDLIDLHKEKKVPLVCGVIPNNFDNPNVGGGYLSNLLRKLNEDESDLFEMGQHGYAHEDLKGKSHEQQKEIIQKGLTTLTSIGIKPTTFVPPFGSADETTIRAAEDLKFKIFVDLYEDLHSDRLLIMNSWVSLTVENDRSARHKFVSGTTTLKQPEQIMTDVDQETGKNSSTVIIIVYYIHDFEIDTNSKLAQLSMTLNILKNSGKYRFMTARQYWETLSNDTMATQTLVTQVRPQTSRNQATTTQTTVTQVRTDTPWSAYWIMYLVIGASATTIFALLTTRVLRRKPTRPVARASTSQLHVDFQTYTYHRKTAYYLYPRSSSGAGKN